MTSLAVQWLRLHLPIHVVNWKIPGWGATISHALGPKNQNIKQNIVTNSIKTFKNGQHQKNLKKRGQQEMLIRNEIHGTSLVVPRLRNLPWNAEDMGSIPGSGRSHMLWGS